MSQVRIKSTLICILVAGALVWGCFRPEPILIGFAGQLTGRFSDLGVQGRNGAQLAVEHINEQGGIDGRPLKLVAIDDGNTPAGARRALDTLHQRGIRLVIGHMTSSQTLAALPHAQELGMILISPTTSTPLLENKRDNHYRVVSSSAKWAAALGRYARETGQDTLLVSYDLDNEAYTKPFIDDLMKSYRMSGGQVLGTLPFRSSNIEDWSFLARRVKAARPEGIVLAASARDTADAARELRRQGQTQPIFATPWAFTKDLLSFAGSTAEGIVSCLSYAPDNSQPAFLQFRKDYVDRFGFEPGFASAFSYEAVLVAAAALERTGGRALGLAKMLTDLGRMQGVSSSFRIDEQGDVHRPYYILAVRDGRLVTVKPIESQ